MSETTTAAPKKPRPTYTFGAVQDDVPLPQKAQRPSKAPNATAQFAAKLEELAVGQSFTVAGASHNGVSRLVNAFGKGTTDGRTFKVEPEAEHLRVFRTA